MKPNLSAALNVYLANIGVEYVKLHHLHWNVVGSQFKAVHEYLETLGDRVRRIHLNETDQLPWGEGKAPLQVYLNHLNQAGYQGPITVEICSKPHYLKPYAAMKNSYDYLKDALARQ